MLAVIPCKISCHCFLLLCFRPEIKLGIDEALLTVTSELIADNLTLYWRSKNCHEVSDDGRIVYCPFVCKVL